ncbi:peptidase inhibitor family I36 protein [Saccharothrix xinjiangensis]|uniref:Peptidase inhibitor family I36 protein n=1 Tax=Saccharothrix xinjiangensis TaxID=204798 RepID=A0ABV9YDK0_9PSEU
MSLTVAAPSAMAAQGCISIPTFCAWEQPYAKGDVYNLVDPEASRCYNLDGARRSFVNDTLYTAMVYNAPNCSSLLFTTLLPRGFINEALPHYSVRFLPI